MDPEPEDRPERAGQARAPESVHREGWLCPLALLEPLMWQSGQGKYHPMLVVKVARESVTSTSLGALGRQRSCLTIPGSPVPLLIMGTFRI